MTIETLAREATWKLTRALEEYGFRADSWKHDRIMFAFCQYLAMAFQEGRREALLEVLKSLRRSRNEEANP